MGREASIDPITFEVLKNAFRAICTEGSALLERVSYSPTISEGHDYSVALLTPDARLIAHGYKDQAPHLGTFEETLKAALSQVDRWSPGDVYLYNDPYTGGTHTNDVKLIRPVFYRDELIAYAIALCHWADAGGPMPGSFNPRAMDFHEEGMRLPAIPLYLSDREVGSTFLLIKMNMRCYVDRLGDIYSQHETAKLMERRLVEYAEKFGLETVRAAFEEVMDHSERMFRRAIAALPDGVYEFSDYGDMDCMHPEKPRIRVHCRLTIEGEDVTLDWTGSDPAPQSSWGFARPALLSAVYDGTMHSFPELAPLNHGIIRHLQIISKPGTCVDVQEPTPVSGYCSGAYEKVDHVTMGCWAQALVGVNPRNVFAGSLNLENLCTGGVHPKTGVDFVSYLWLEGGAGACTFRDGTSLINSIYVSGASNQPIESWERWYPMVLTSCDIIQDSCGDGRYRGGFGIKRNFRVTGDTIITIHGDREFVTPYGISGGTNGGPNRLMKNEGTPEEENLGMFAVGVRCKPGDHITFESNGGGGCGNPLLRPPEEVLEDVIDEYISLKKAREVYGVAIREIDKEVLHYEIDWEETERLRRELARRPLPRGEGPWEVNPEGEKIKVEFPSMPTVTIYVGEGEPQG